MEIVQYQRESSAKDESIKRVVVMETKDWGRIVAISHSPYIRKPSRLTYSAHLMKQAL
jgi:hypothetical protein